MSSILNTKHSPPNAMDDNADIAIPRHSPSAILTESYVADAFCKRYHGLIKRLEDDDGEVFFLVPTIMCDGDYGPSFPHVKHQGCVVPHSFVWAKIRELMAELLEGRDEFTVIRCNAFSFVDGVWRFMLIDDRITPKKMRPSDDDYTYAKASTVTECWRDPARRQRAAA
jgi:hypothetical protein